MFGCIKDWGEFETSSRFRASVYNLLTVHAL